jgi:cystathionine gamma-synthase
MACSYEDCYFDEDAVYMERNSRTFRRRIGIIDDNTESLCDFLYSHSLAVGVPSVIKDVFYPKWITRDEYELCRIKGRTSDDAGNKVRDGGFGGLFSLTFTTAAASSAFFDALSCHKGPSLGTNFTLACPYTILAHYLELEWAAGYGVEATLVRVSIGMEEKGALLCCFAAALKAAENASEA